jgi:hypothetical protein
MLGVMESEKYITEVYPAGLQQQSNSAERKKAHASTRLKRFFRRAGISTCV